MPWAFVRPADPSVLVGRPLLDIGTGDGQTLRATVEEKGLIVGIDRSLVAPRGLDRTVIKITGGDARALPFIAGAFETVLAADLLHHLDDDDARSVLGEISRVLRPGGVLVAWWYSEITREDPHGPRFARTAERGAQLCLGAGFVKAANLKLEVALEPSPPTAGIVATA